MNDRGTGKYERLLERCGVLEAVPTAVAHPCKESALARAMDAASQGLIRPILVVPGGIGTVLESMVVWQLLQVRHVENTPLIFVGNMWRELVEWGRTYMLREGAQLASPEDFDIPVCVDTAEEVIAAISEPHRKWLES